MAYLFFIVCHIVASTASIMVFDSLAGVWVSWGWVVIASTSYLISKAKI